MEKIEENSELELNVLEEEMKERNEKFEKIETEGIHYILKYFDRIHDKLFNFNNILIVGYFALSKIYNSISVLNILIPICNLVLLIFIEYRMMEKSRFESNITHKPLSEIDKYGRQIRNTNLLSLTSITTTLVVTAMFLFYLFSS